MKYVQGTCYWCGGPLPIVAGRKKGFSSFSTDTLSTPRDFCSEVHCMAFMTYCKANNLGEGMHYRLPPYWGAKIERMAKKGKTPIPPKVPIKSPRLPKVPSYPILPQLSIPTIPEKEVRSSLPDELRQPWTKERQDEFIARITKKDK